MANITDQFVTELGDLQKTIDSTIETKADVEVVETTKAELIKHTDDSIEVVKAENVEMKASIEALEAKVADVATVEVSKKEESMDFTKQTQEDGTTYKGLSLNYVAKAYNDNTDVSGGRVDANGLFFTLEAGNFARMYGDLWITTSGSIKIPVLSGIAFTSEGTVNTGRTKGGSLAVSTAVIDNLVSENQISKPAMEDIPMMDQKISGLMMQEAAKKEAEDAVAALKAASFTEVNTGVASTLPTAANIVGKLSDMKKGLSSAYLPGAKWFMSREAMGVLENSALSTGGGLHFNITTGLTTLWGYEIVVVDYLETGATAGHFAVYFGDMKKALSFVSRKSLEIGRYMETAPGFVTYFGDVRSVSVVVDTKALIGLKTAA